MLNVATIILFFIYLAQNVLHGKFLAITVKLRFNSEENIKLHFQI
jgi:hypothetical protein